MSICLFKMNNLMYLLWIKIYKYKYIFGSVGFYFSLGESLFLYLFLHFLCGLKMFFVCFPFSLCVSFYNTDSKTAHPFFCFFTERGMCEDICFLSAVR